MSNVAIVNTMIRNMISFKDEARYVVGEFRNLAFLLWYYVKM